MEKDEDYLMMSGIQHFDFCRRQWALIHIEQQWEENFLTAEGKIDHKKCHDDKIIEKRKNIIIIRGMRVISHKLKMSGICDVVEFHKNENGITLNKYDDRWLPFPIEYKHGHEKTIDADRLQLCAQAISLEEMLVCNIEFGFLYYKENNKREKVVFTDELRNKTISVADEMNSYFERTWTPSAKISSKCKSCSLKEICVPKLGSKRNVNKYIEEYIKECE